MIDGKSEQAVDDAGVAFQLHLRDRLVGAAIRKVDEVHHRALDDHGTQADLAAKERKYLGARVEPLDVRVGDLAWTFQAMQGDVVRFDLELREVPAEVLDLDTSAGHALELGYKFAPDAVLKAIAGEIKAGSDDDPKQSDGDDGAAQHAGSALGIGGIAHRAPVSFGTSMRRMRACARRFFKYAPNRSSMRCCTSISSMAA